MSSSAPKDKHMILLHDISEIPDFKDETEEHAFWKTHAFSDELLEKVGPDDLPPLQVPPRASTHSSTVTIRFDDDTLRRLRVLAHDKHLGYQTLLKRFVIERLYEEEQRTGRIPNRRKVTRPETH